MILYLGFVLRAPGYPEEITVECVEPENYTQNWKYLSWMNGKWNNLENIIECLDPGLF
jgi:hypothetical protein